MLPLACGKRKPPVPPKERVLQRVELTGFQRGNQVVLSWKMPARNAPKGDVLNISRADIYRLVEPMTAPLQLSEEEFANRSSLIAAVKITDSDFGLQTLTHRDTLEFAGQPARIRYAVRLVNASGQRAAFSNALLIEPTASLASTPSQLTAEATQEMIRLEWQAPVTNIDGSTPVSIIGYNIYRSTSDKVPATLLNKAPIRDTSYEDVFFDFDKDYYYFVRAVSAGRSAEPVESAESNIVKFRAVDKFPPSPPAAITVAAAPGVISIFFALNPESDVAGYHIYRSTDPNLAKENWTRLTTEILKANTFQDRKVESSVTYHYYVTATDRFGNVSQPSEVVSETAP
jgi:fibronectin type 3 domain-containing protein